MHLNNDSIAYSLQNDAFLSNMSIVQHTNANQKIHYLTHEIDGESPTQLKIKMNEHLLSSLKYGNIEITGVFTDKELEELEKYGHDLPMSKFMVDEAVSAFQSLFFRYFLKKQSRPQELTKFKQFCEKWFSIYYKSLFVEYETQQSSAKLFSRIMMTINQLNAQSRKGSFCSIVCSDWKVSETLKNHPSFVIDQNPQLNNSRKTIQYVGSLQGHQIFINHSPQPKNSIVVFNNITKQDIDKAYLIMKNVDVEMIKAYEAGKYTNKLSCVIPHTIEDFANNIISKTINIRFRKEPFMNRLFNKIEDIFFNEQVVKQMMYQNMQR